MSPTIKSFESSGTALAALCIAGMSSHANASTVTVDLNLNYASDLYTSIAIDSATPQFYYNSEVSQYKTYFGTLNSGMLATSLLAGSPDIDSSLTYVPKPSGIKVAGLSGLQTGYIQLSWLNDSSVQEYGYATFTGGNLDSITGNDITVTSESVANTPLPASWALFVGGVGLLGLVAKRRRRKAVA